MACASSNEENMADFEQSFEDVLDAPADILRYGVVEKISMALSIVGTLSSWKNVADELNFNNLEISGHYANFAGSESAMRMLNDWIYKRNGKIGQLVKVFLKLELYACLEYLKEDLEKYRKESDRLSSTISDSATPSLQSEYSSSGSSAFTSTSTIPDSSLQSIDPSTPKSLESDISLRSLPCPYTPNQRPSDCIDKCTSQPSHNTTTNPECSSKTISSAIGTAPSPRPTPSPKESLIQYSDWPAPVREIQRSISVPHEKNNKTKSKSKRRNIFKRSKSMESKTSHKKWPFFSRKKDAKKPTSSEENPGVISDNTADEYTCDAQVRVEGFHSEEATKEKPNLSPLIVSEEKCQRPVSSGSEDSLRLSPSSPTSPGYESGYHSGDNSTKRIYIVCNPDEEVVFQRALQMYQKFCRKGYECHMFATNLEEVMEIGRFRYEMQQILDADYVFVCVSKNLKEIFEVPLRKRPAFKDDDTKGLRHVSDFMMTFLAKDCCNKNGKLMTILLTDDSYDHVPMFMGQYLRYKWPEQEKRMENTIHKRNEIPFAPVSSAKVLAKVKLCTPEGIRMEHKHLCHKNLTREKITNKM